MGVNMPQLKLACVAPVQGRHLRGGPILRHADRDIIYNQALGIGPAVISQASVRMMNQRLVVVPATPRPLTFWPFDGRLPI